MTEAEATLVKDIKARRLCWANTIDQVLVLTDLVEVLDADIEHWKAVAIEGMKSLSSGILARAEAAEARVVAFEAENAQLREWRTDVTVALQKPGGCCYADVPREICALREHVEAMSETCKNCGCQCEDMPEETEG